MAISPSLISSSPASMRSSVDFPQPEGPTSTVNSPSGMSMLTPRMTCVPPKDFCTSRICTDAMRHVSLCRAAPRALAVLPGDTA